MKLNLFSATSYKSFSISLQVFHDEGFIPATSSSSSPSECSLRRSRRRRRAHRIERESRGAACRRVSYINARRRRARSVCVMRCECEHRP